MITFYWALFMLAITGFLAYLVYLTHRHENDPHDERRGRQDHDGPKPEDPPS